MILLGLMLQWTTSAAVLYDGIPGFELVPPDGFIPAYQDSVAKTAPAQQFVGDGQQIGSIDILWSFTRGDNGGNHAPTGYETFGIFYGDRSSYDADSFGNKGINSPFSLAPVSSTLYGQSGDKSVWLMHYDVTSLGIYTTDGQVQSLGYFTHGNEISPGVLGNAWTSGGGSGPQGLFASSWGNSPDVLSAHGVLNPHLAIRITTVPEPSTIALLAIGGGFLALRAIRRRSK